MYYSAPVDASANPASASDGDIPAGWTVTVGHATASDTVHPWRTFVTCSASSDAVIELGPSPGVPGVQPIVAMCPAGRRAIGGGMAQAYVGNLMPPDTSGAFLYESGPVDGSGLVIGTRDGDVPVGWRDVAGVQYGDYGHNPVAVCSATADATVRSTSMTLPVAMAGAAAGAAAATCPAGQVATSGGLAREDDGDDHSRVGFAAPVADVAGISSIATGATPRSWYVQSRASDTQVRTFRVFVVCVTAPPPADTSPPDTTISKGPKKKTTSRKAKFSFTSEPGATFTCVLDNQAARPCASAYKVTKLKTGKHRMTVTAKDAAGNADPTPASYSWKVKKKRKKPKLHRRVPDPASEVVSGRVRP
jgi:hypothetical protein